MSYIEVYDKLQYVDEKLTGQVIFRRLGLLVE